MLTEAECSGMMTYCMDDDAGITVELIFDPCNKRCSRNKMRYEEPQVKNTQGGLRKWSQAEMGEHFRKKKKVVDIREGIQVTRRVTQNAYPSPRRTAMSKKEKHATRRKRRTEQSRERWQETVVTRVTTTSKHEGQVDE